jgi:triphosphatase
MPAPQALQALVAEILQLLLPHLAHLAHLAGTPEEQALSTKAESLHQFRVALRRLRSAAWLFGGHAPAWNPAWQVALRELFAASGMARDQEVLQSGLLPTLQALKAPLVELPALPRPASLSPLLQSPAVSELVLDLLEFALSDAPVEPAADAPGDAQHQPHDQPLLGLVVPALKALRRRLARDVSRLAELDDASLHRLRKRLKRLRYSLEFVAPLLPDRGTRRYLAALQRAQDSLGAWHDMTVAEGLYRQAASADPRAWFAVGWAAARKGLLRDEASRYLTRWVRLKGPW